MDCYVCGTLAAKLSLAIETCISIDDQNQQLWELDGLGLVVWTFLGRVLSPGFAATRFLSTRLNPRHRILVTHLLQALNIPYCVLIFAFLNRSLCC